MVLTGAAEPWRRSPTGGVRVTNAVPSQLPAPMPRPANGPPYIPAVAGACVHHPAKPRAPVRVAWLVRREDTAATKDGDDVELVYFRGDDVLYDIPGLAARSSLAPEPSSADVAAMEVPLSTPMPPDIVRLADSVEVARTFLAACTASREAEPSGSDAVRPRWRPHARAVWSIDPLRFVRGIADWSNIAHAACPWDALHGALAEARRSAGELAGALPPARTVLVGHSRGGVVVSRLLSTRSDTSSEGARALADSVVQAVWADVGSNVPGEAHITDATVARTTVAIPATAVMWRDGPATAVGDVAKFRLTVVGTPRQWRDRRRAFVEEEKDAMLAIFRDAATQQGGLQPIEQHALWTDGGEGNLLDHFRVLEDVDFGA